MRPDFPQLLCERPRGGRYHFFKNRREKPRYPTDDLPKQAGIKPRNVSHKHLGEYLSPLRRFLLKQVGRPWNKVKSEIGQICPRQNPVLEHVYTHLDGFIETKVQIIDGKPYELYPGGYQPVEARGTWRTGLYVDPRDGIIKRAKQNPRLPPKREQEKRFEFINATTGIYRTDEGIWFEIKFGVPPDQKPVHQTDVWRYRDPLWSLTQEMAYYRISPPQGMNIIGKRQLSKAELRKYGVTNHPTDD